MALEKTNTLLEKNKALQETANKRELVALLKQEVELLERKQTTLLINKI